MSDWIIYLPTLLALLGLAVMGAKFSWIKKQNSGEAKMQTIAHHIKEGAMAFLNAEYRILLIFCTSSLSGIGIYFLYRAHHPLVDCSCIYRGSCVFCHCG